MKWASVLSEEHRTEAAIEATAAALRAEFGGVAPDLVLCFASTHHWPGYGALPALLGAQLPGALLFGCSAGGVIGGGREIEQRPALSLMGASLPGVRLQPLELPPDDLPDTRDAHSWQALCGGIEPTPHFLLLADPFTCDVDALCAALDNAFPESCKIGGLASGGRSSGDSTLFLGDRLRSDGAVGIALSGNISVDTIVAQGCRTIGKPLLITRCRDNVIEELTGGTPVKVLRELYESLPPRDRELFQGSLFLGIEMRSNQVELRQGDFLIRHILGVDPSQGALVVAAQLRPYQAVQFHVRDARASAEDLGARLRQYRETLSTARPRGALVFSCLGRGEALYGRPDHDSTLFREVLGPVPLGGFFCNGEIGSVGGTTFVHGYTSSFGLFRERH